MNLPKTSYKIIAIGNIELKWTSNSPTQNQLTQHKNLVEEIWYESQEESNGKLFNSTLLNFIKLDKHDEDIKITGSFVEYKQFLAQQKRPELNLGIKPICVSGITILKERGTNYAILARRAKETTEYPEYLELVPSGSIDKEYAQDDKIVDYKSKLLQEFTEEACLSRDCVKDISEFAFVLDTNDNVYDICCKITIDAQKDLVSQNLSKSKEYRSPVFITADELEDFVKRNYNSMVPTSIALIKALDMIKNK